MRAVVQRVKKASVTVEGKDIAEIDKGLLIFLGVEKNDSEDDIDYMVNKIAGLRIFEDEEEKMNYSLEDIGGDILLVSQFTLYGDVRKGRRPNFMDSADAKKGREYYEEFINKLRSRNIRVETGKFAADMDVALINDGPVTILIDSNKIF